MSEPRHLDLVDRLRGQYHLPVNDGTGPLNGSMTFSREFPTPPIQKEAADEIEQLRALLKPFADLEMPHHVADDWRVFGRRFAFPVAGDFRRARAALLPKEAQS